MSKFSLEELENIIKHHNKCYWDNNAPEISDYDYDKLIEQLRKIKPNSSVLNDFGAQQFGSSVKHKIPMLSLDKCYDDNGLLNWANKFKGDVVVTPKMDGIACSILYDKNGRLLRAATRGNGIEGDDITINVRTISGIPSKISLADVEVRGEIYMKLSIFKKFEEQFSNPRNLAAGAIKHKDPERCKNYGLSFMAYGLLGTNDATEHDKFVRLNKFGFDPIEYKVVSKKLLRQGYEYFAKKRSQLDYEIDGVVFKADDIKEQQKLGSTSHHPKWGMAYKFQGDSGTTILNDVEWSVARSGAITPVAIIQPIDLSGASVARASLHNAGFINKLGLTLGAEVVVTRRGGVIPNVEFVAKAGKVPVKLPTKCPSCGSSTNKDGDFLYCGNPDSCRQVVIASVAHYCKVLDIQGFGDRILAEIYDKGILKSPLDLYKLNCKNLCEIERVGDRLAEKLITQINDHRELELATFLRALGIEELGKHVSVILAEKYKTIDAVRKIKVRDLAAIHSIGDVIARKVVYGFLNKADFIDNLLKEIKLKQQDKKQTNGILKNKSVVFTGKMISCDRKVAQKMVLDLGGSVPSGVTKELDLLVIGDGKEGNKSSKQVKAEKYIADGATIKIINEGDFFTMIKEKE